MVIPGGVLPIDLALAVALPVHSHIALNFVVSDYVPKVGRGRLTPGLSALGFSD
jgi:succinate dehydrogenase (ubiquinone) membrane anchor subunit